MIKHFCLLILIFLTTSITLYAGVTPPEPNIAKTYTIGIVSDRHRCLMQITNEINRNGYQFAEVPADFNDPRVPMDQYDLDFLIYISESELTLMVKKGDFPHTFDLVDLKNYCKAPVEFIWQMTQEVNSDEEPKDLSPEDMAIAIANLVEQVKKDPNDYRASLKLSNLYHGKKDYKKEKEYLDKAEGVNSRDCAIVIAIGNYFLRHKMFSEAREKFEECLNYADQINSNIANYNIGRTYKEEGNHSDAIKSYTKVHSQSSLSTKAKRQISELKRLRKENLVKSLTAGSVVLFLSVVGIVIYRKKKRKSHLKNPDNNHESKLIDDIDTNTGSAKKSFDVFMAYNGKDEEMVLTIYKELLKNNINPWIAEEHAPEGRPFVESIQEVIEEVNSAAIFIGPHGLGKWQKVELRSLISQFVDKDIPVIPVLLPSVETIPKEQLFLRAFTHVKFETITDTKALTKLIKGINKSKPNPETPQECL